MKESQKKVHTEREREKERKRERENERERERERVTSRGNRKNEVESNTRTSSCNP